MPLKRMVIFVVLFLFALRTYAQEDSIIVDTNFYECFTRELIITSFWEKVLLRFRSVRPKFRIGFRHLPLMV